ncbi:MAG: carboxypeptidase regulatory-like domain-containing protein [Thermoplasmata archaeon]
MSFRWLDKISREKEQSSSKTRWWEENWGTLTCLVGVFIIALFIRVYFAFELATKFGTPYLLSGGSDAYYYERIINYIAENHQHLLYDNLRKYPFGAGNPRPPIYGWSVVLGGYVIYPFVGNMSQAISYSFILSTGIWGALTIFPVYLIGRDTFGKKAGIAAVFLLAVSSGHLQRSVITNGDHDAIYLFFAVTAFYFFMRSLKDISEEVNWVTDWTKWSKIKSGLSRFAAKNKKSLLYAGLAGMATATVALTWKGYPYVMVIILVYFAFQLIVDRFQGKDSLGITACVGVTMAVAFIVAAPYYIGANIGSNIFTGLLSSGPGKWFDIPLLMFLVAFAVGIFFTITRDLPWVLVFSILGIGGAIYIGLGATVLPSLLEPISSAGGYFIQNKLYSTIAEAQAPQFSNIVLSFGILTFFLAFLGIALAIWHLKEYWRKPFMFVLVWTAFAIYMATSAARFIFNSSPAFALTAGWIIALLIDKADFSSIATRFRKFRGNYIRALREGIKIRHILVILTVIFLVLMPNVLYAFDSGIPSDDKKEYNDQIYNSLPNAMRPEDYNVSSQDSWYLGAFGYQMDKPIDYWPAAWDWFSEKDKDLEPKDRPAFLSWWDYGFECIEEGEHPTVADNFQVGYMLAGNILMAQNESEVISLMTVRLLELPIQEEGEFNEDVKEILIKHIGEAKTEKLEEVMTNFGEPKYKEEVLNNPERYYPRADDIHPKNVKYAYTMAMLSEEGVGTTSSLYRDVSLELDKRIKYLAADSRLFPKSARNTGIFYAPAKLAGYRIDEGGEQRSPVDFYRIKLVGSDGMEYDSREDVPENVQIVDYNINFQPMFYNTTMYRVMAGYSGKEIGLDQGIPGIDQLEGSQQQQLQQQQQQQYNPMPSWGMKHFSMVYRTAYYNPYKDYENHTDSWRAISYDKAKEYQQEEKGTVDRSARSYMNQGVVFLEYYDGAILKGTVKTNDSQPIPNANVTVLDEEFTPHDVTRTDSNGRYEVILPEGNNSVVVTNGGIDSDQAANSKLLKTESINLGQEKFEVTDEEAMREKVDKNSDGVWDYNKKHDFTVDTANLSGRVYIDTDGNEEYNKNNDTLVSSDVIIENKTAGIEYTISAENGSYEINNLVPGQYTVKADTPGSSELTGVKLEPGSDNQEDISVSTGTVKGNYTVDEEIGVKEFTLRLENVNNDKYEETTFTAGEDDNYTFDNVVPGTYNLSVRDENYCLKKGPMTFEIKAGSPIDKQISISEAHELKLKTVKDGNRIRYQSLSIYDKEGVGYTRTVSTAEDGQTTIKVPALSYRIYGQYQKGSENQVHMGTVTVTEDETYIAEFEKGYRVRGHVDSAGFRQNNFNILFVNKNNPSEEAVVTSNHTGVFDIDLTKGTYSVYGWKETTAQKKFSLNEITVESSGYLSLLAKEGELVEGRIYRDMNNDGEYDEGEGIRANVQIESSDKTATFTSLRDGSYSLVMPDSKTEVEVSKEGFETVTKTYRPGKEFESNIALTADNVTVKGNLTFDNTYVDDIGIKFEAESDGAITKQIEADGTSYTADLKPGKYNVIIDTLLDDGKAKYELSKSIDISPGDDSLNLDLTPVYEYRVTGILKDKNNEKVDAEVTFVGPQEKEITGQGEYIVYLEKGEYSIRAINRDKDISEQTKLVVDGSTKLNITLYDNVMVNPEVIYKGETKGDVPVTFRNKFSGYEITEISNQDGEINIPLTPGEYNIIIDYETEEHVEGTIRDVRYYYDEEYDISTPISPSLELNRELINATLTGDVKADGQYIDEVEIQFISLISDKLSTSVKTGDDGAYSLGLAEGPYTVYVSHKKGQYIYSYLDNFKMGEEKTLDINLNDAVRIDGKLTIDGERVTASLEFEGKGISKSFEVSEDGTFRAVVPKGKYTLKASTTRDTQYGLTEYKFNKDYTFTTSRDLDIGLNKVKEYGLEIVNDLEKKSAAQSERVRYYVQIKNTGNTKDTYLLSSTSNWQIKYSEENITLNPKETKTVEISVKVDENATVDHESVKLRIDSANSDESLEKVLPIEVKQVYGTKLKPEITNKKYSNGIITYTINLNNTGNGEDRYSMNIINKKELSNLGWDASVVNITEKINAHEEKSIEISLTSNRERPNKNVKIEVTATSVGDETKSSTEQYETEMPQLSQIGSIDMKDGGVRLEEEEFSLKTWQWVLIVILVAVGAYYILKKKRWIR